MARFLSADWFAQLEEAFPATPSAPGTEWVLEHVVSGTPEGEVRYQVVVADGTTRLRGVGTHPPKVTFPPMVTFTSDYPTSVAIARGQLSTQAALLDGRVRVAGDLSGIGAAARQSAGIDLIPASVRAETTY